MQLAQVPNQFRYAIIFAAHRQITIWWWSLYKHTLNIKLNYGD